MFPISAPQVIPRAPEFVKVEFVILIVPSGITFNPSDLLYWLIVLLINGDAEFVSI